MQVFVIMTDGSELIGVAANEEIAIRKMIDYIKEYDNRYHWFENQEQDESDNYTKEDAIADIKLNLQADGFIYAEPAENFGASKIAPFLFH